MLDPREQPSAIIYKGITDENEVYSNLLIRFNNKGEAISLECKFESISESSEFSCIISSPRNFSKETHDPIAIVVPNNTTAPRWTKETVGNWRLKLPLLQIIKHPKRKKVLVEMLRTLGCIEFGVAKWGWSKAKLMPKRRNEGTPKVDADKIPPRNKSYRGRLEGDV
ncbi:hypothetical protein LIER_01369 [Lithospermum erythrorhizon]|uniref:Uncharacterized protein n=1 Tax=Lithospermum erythrorhizon TaxID=34254 RepID=A0AAV3NLP9_LITER